MRCNKCGIEMQGIATEVRDPDYGVICGNCDRELTAKRKQQAEFEAERQVAIAEFEAAEKTGRT